MKDQLIADYVNGRVDIVRKSDMYRSLDLGKLAVEAAQVVSSDPLRFSGKLVLRAIRGEFRTRHGRNMNDSVISLELKNEDLAAIAKKTFKGESQQTTKIRRA